MNLFDYADRYPNAPGYKRRSASKAAARLMGANGSTLRADVLRAIHNAPAGLTADECAATLGQTVLAIRPRVSELATTGKIIESEQRRPNASGRSAIVWKAAPDAA